MDNIIDISVLSSVGSNPYNVAYDDQALTPCLPLCPCTHGLVTTLPVQRVTCTIIIITYVTVFGRRMLVNWLLWSSFSFADVFTRLVVDTTNELMRSDGEGRKSLDLLRIVQEGDKVNTRVVESDCPGVMEETAEYEFITMEGGKEKSHTVEITRVLDSVTERTIFNAEEPWVVGHVRIR